MKDFFDYHYYRIAKFYYKKDGTDANTALMSVSAVQSWIIFNIFLFIKGFLVKDEKYKYEWIVIIFTSIGFYLYNKKKYRNKYFEFRNKWINENKNRKIIKGILIILTIVFSWTLIFINALVFNKFN